MAVVPYTFVSLTNLVWGNNAIVYSWTPIGADSTGQPVGGPGFTDRSFQIEGSGTFGTVTIEGSNDGVNYHTLHDPFANLLSFIAPALAEVTEMCLWMRPRLTGGDGSTVITVTAVLCNHQNN